MERIILASKSPRRRQLLEWAEIPFDVIVTDTDEMYPASLPIDAVPVYIAKNKALAVKAELNHNRLILAADTIVVLKDKVIGKPASAADAVNTLKELSGQTHQVITGVVLIKDETEIAFADITEVEFHTLTDQQIEYYVEHYQPFDKAGAYAIQEWIGVVGIKRVEGDFYNVMGLPVSRVVKALRQF